jgi:alkylation response protein AidB-like acyl-CoA dehydrogenase
VLTGGETTAAGIRDRVSEFLAANDPAAMPRLDFLRARFDAGLAWVHYPAGLGGLGAPRALQAVADAEFAAAAAPDNDPGRNAIGLGMAAPTIRAFGSDEQHARWLRPLWTGEEIWCQLFSEPGAGSDLASLATRAVRDPNGDWIVSGQKVWTSIAHEARWGILDARTDPDVPKHQGLTYFGCDMTANGVDVRPLRQLTGEAEFNEVFFTDVFVPDDRLVGLLNEGWRVANSTLSHERGTSPRQLVIHIQLLEEMLTLAAREGAFDDERLRQQLAQAYVEVRLFQLHNWRSVSRLARQQQPGPEGSSLKLYWSEMSKRLHDVALAVLGPSAPLWGEWQRSWLYYQGASIWAGTNEIQRNIIGERVLGLPRS